MKEYEFIVNAIEEDLCDQLVSVICRENYEDEKHADGFRRIFDEYGKLHELYLKEEDDIRKDGSLNTYRNKWEQKRKQRLEWFIKDLEEERNGLNVAALAAKYLERLEKEEIQILRYVKL